MHLTISLPLHLQNNVYVLVLTQGNSNAAAAFRFMRQARRQAAFFGCAPTPPTQVITLFKSYFTTVDEDSLRNNFVLIYELLDGARALLKRRRRLRAAFDFCAQTEVMDDGYPQILSSEALKLYITQEGVHSELAPNDIRRRAQDSRNATMQVTGAVSWRREGLKYKSNEVFLDIVESINVLMTSKGAVLRCDVTGKVLMKCFLSVRCHGAVVSLFE